MKPVKKLSVRRSARLRTKLRKRTNGRPRLSVFRSSRHIYAQVIDDSSGKTLVSASTLAVNTNETISKGGNISAASMVGKELAVKAVESGIKDVVFDRGSYSYHGRVKALADAAREAGLSF